jgi:hypothetical protein
MMINGSPYLANGTPQRCALCNASFMTEDEHIKCREGKDHRYYSVPSTLISACPFVRPRRHVRLFDNIAKEVVADFMPRAQERAVDLLRAY